MKSKFTLPMSRKLFLVSLLGLVSVGLWLLVRPSGRPDVTGAADTPSDTDTVATISTITKPAIPASPVWIQDDTPASIPLANTNAESAGAKPAIPGPDDLEDFDEIREWARQNAVAALAWLSNAPEGPKRDAVAEMVCAQVAQSDAAQAVALAERFGSVTNALLENMVHLWADQDTAAACTYATNKPAGEPRDRLLGRVAFVLSKQSPAEAAKLVADLISPGELQDEAAISVLHQWVLLDTNAATAWVQLFPDGALRDRAVREVESIVSVPPFGNGTAPESGPH
jgi:hypothetical protein